MNDALVNDQEARDMEEHGQHDQWQTPSPVRTPGKRIVRQYVESGLGNAHRVLFQRRNGQNRPLRNRTETGSEVGRAAFLAAIVSCLNLTAFYGWRGGPISGVFTGFAIP